MHVNIQLIHFAVNRSSHTTVKQPCANAIKKQINKTQQKPTLAQFWNLEVQSQGADWARFSCGPEAARPTPSPAAWVTFSPRPRSAHSPPLRFPPGVSLGVSASPLSWRAEDAGHPGFRTSSEQAHLPRSHFQTGLHSRAPEGGPQQACSEETDQPLRPRLALPGTWRSQPARHLPRVISTLSPTSTAKASALIGLRCRQAEQGLPNYLFSNLFLFFPRTF